MSIFDLLFLLLALLSIVTLITSAMFAVRGKGAKALTTLKWWLVCAAFYICVSVGVSAVAPQKTYSVGEDWCLDDWCLRVAKVVRTPTATFIEYKLDLLVSSKMRFPQRAKGAWLYLLDDGGRKYKAEPANGPQIDSELAPREQVNMVRVFRVPADSHIKGLMTGHGGPYCGIMDFLVIGQSGCLFNKPTMIRLD